jgi:type VI secretion system protein ImpJ
MFLRPHHLQQYDLYLESRDIAYVGALEHYGWGLIRFELEEESLNNFVLGVKALRAVLPEGTLVDVPGNARLLSRALDKGAYEAGQPLDVAIGVRRLEARRPQTREEGGSGGQSRYVAVAQEVYDLDAGRDPSTIEQVEYDLQFFLGSEPADGFETLPVARLMFSGDAGRPVMPAPDFAPPCLALAGSPVLHGIARAVVERLSTVLREKAEVRRSDQVGQVILYQALSSSLPVLSDMVQDGKVHPRRVYQEMARLVGTLYFRDTEGRSFDDIPVYDHRAPGPVFQGLRTLIRDLSEVEIVRRYRIVPMERAGDVFRAGMPAEGKTPGSRLYFEVTAVESTPRVPGLLQTAKVSTPERIETLKQFALPGIVAERLPGPPPELPPGLTGAFFRLKIEEGEEWNKHALQAQAMAAFLLGAPRDIALKLIIILPG